MPTRPATHKPATRKMQRLESAQRDKARGTARERGYSAAWERAARAFLKAHPLCMCDECDEGRIRITPATVVDHKTPHRGSYSLFWDSNNWQSLSKRCHDHKTATHDGGFGKRANSSRSS